MGTFWTLSLPNTCSALKSCQQSSSSFREVSLKFLLCGLPEAPRGSFERDEALLSFHCRDFIPFFPHNDLICCKSNSTQVGFWCSLSENTFRWIWTPLFSFLYLLKKKYFFASCVQVENKLRNGCSWDIWNQSQVIYFIWKYFWRVICTSNIR